MVIWLKIKKTENWCNKMVFIDDFMRWTLIIEFVGALGIGRTIWAGAQLGDKKGRQWKESKIAFIVLVGTGIAALFLLVVYLGFPDFLTWMYMGLPEIVRWVGFAASIVVCIFLLWVFKTIGKAGAKHVIVSEDMKLVTTGPYSRIRHPMYTGLLFYSITWFLITDHWGVSAVFFGLMLFIIFIRTPDEENALIEKFGDEYRQYMDRTSRYLPFKSKKKPDSSN